MTITDEDRAAVGRHGLWLWDEERDDLAEAFAAHRQAAFNAGLERAAELWERHKYNGSFGEVIRAEKEKPQ